MPNTKSAKKCVRQNKKRKERNKAYRTKIKNIIKEVKEEEDKKKAEELLKDAYSIFDKAVSKNIIHRNNAARKKKLLHRIVREK